MSFQFPDPSVSTTYTAPNGENWVYIDGVWEIDDHVIGPVDEHVHAAYAARDLEEEVDQNEEQLQAISTALFNAQQKIESLEDLDIQNALSALAQASQDIIELKSKVSSLELTSFLILE